MNKIASQAAALILCSLIAGSSLAASYDCTKASTWVEQAICDSPQLSELDSELGEQYLDLRRQAKRLDQVRYRRLQREQKAWLRTRNRCTNLTCLYDRYQQRIGELEQFHEELCAAYQDFYPCYDR